MALRVIESSVPGVLAGSEIELDTKPSHGLMATLGRTSCCTVRLDAPDISRHHAEVHRLAGGHYALRDAGSLGGTFVDGARLAAEAPVFLRAGARVRFASSLTCEFADRAPRRKRKAPEREGSVFRARGAARVAEEIASDLCAVCQDLPVAAHALACGHVFCGECVSRWARVRGTCPTCRAPAGRPVPALAVDRLVAALAEPVMDEEERSRRKERAARWVGEQAERRAASAFKEALLENFCLPAGASAGANVSARQDLAHLIGQHFNDPLRTFLSRWAALAAGETSEARAVFD
jgi:hypothetical protein